MNALQFVGSASLHGGEKIKKDYGVKYACVLYRVKQE
jgi:hypothetical protein